MTVLRRDEPEGVVRALIRDAAIEIIPLKSAYEKLEQVPVGATVTVTVSKKLGLERTLDFATVAARAGYRVVPHLAARQIPDLRVLREYVDRLTDVGVRDLYVIGGDADDTGGAYPSAAALLEALGELGHSFASVGVACYPEGHPEIADDVLAEALRRSRPHATYMVSQLCFDPAAIVGWTERTRADGNQLPLHLGVAAPLQIRKLAELSLRIGVGSSVRYLTKQHGFVGTVLKGSSYRPEELLERLGPDLSRDDLDIAGLHVFTFNQVAETVDWQARIAR